MTHDDARTILSLVQLAASVLMAVFLAYVNAKAKKIDTLEAELKRATGEAIDQKLASLRTEMAAPRELMAQQIQQIQHRLDRGESRFAKLDDARHGLEVQVLKEIGALRDVVATKDDLKRLREELQK